MMQKITFLSFWTKWGTNQDVEIAIAREKQLKGWTRLKKENLIKDFNPDWKFLNKEIE